MREQLVGKGQEYERGSAASNYNKSSNVNPLSYNNRPMVQQNQTSLPTGALSSNAGYRDDVGGDNSPSKRRFRRMETITATTFKMATPNQNQTTSRANLNTDYDYDHRQKTMLPVGPSLPRRYEEQCQPIAIDFNKDMNRFNYIDDDQYQRGSRNSISSNQTNFKTNNQYGMANTVNKQSSVPSPTFLSNRLKRPLPRGQFFDS